MESEDGEGMEPPNSVEDDQTAASGEGDQSTGFAIIDGRSEGTTASADSDSIDDGDALSVDQWLAAAHPANAATDDGEVMDDDEEEEEEEEEESEDSDSDSAENGSDDASAPDGEQSEAAAAADPGSNMSEIMAELLAAAEKSAEGDGDATEADADKADATAIAAPEKPKRPSADQSDAAANSDADAAVDSDAEDSGTDDPTSNDSAPSDKTEPDDKNGSETDGTSTDDEDGSKANGKLDEKDKAGEKDESDSKADRDGDDAAESDDNTKVDGKTKSDSKSESVAAKVGDETTKTVAPGGPLAKTDTKSSSFPVVKAAVATVIGLYALLVAAWAVDLARHSDQAMRGVQLATVDVGGLDRDGLSDTIDDLTNELGDRSVEVSIGDETITTDPVTLGARFDRDRMIDEALSARRSGLLFIRPFTWATGLFSTESVEPRYVVDTDVAGEAATDVIEAELDQPVEPTLELQGSRMTVTPGSPGVTVEPREIVGRLPAAIEEGEPYELTLIPRDSDPEIETATIAEIADEINERTGEPIAIQVLDDEIEVSPRMLKSWIDLDLDEDEPTWVVAEDRALEDLKPLFPGLGSEDQQATFKVVNEVPIIVPAAETVICCEAGIGDDLRRTIDRRLPATVTEEDESGEEVEVQPLRTVTLAPEITGFDEGVEELESLGIVELVSTFTTKHACCANRVKNIQRFADLTQGVIIRPGEEFSLNGFVGRRTRENGFVADGAIALGNFEQQVGGGISQYATTFFNASFFAGVEFLEYQSHSIYISRYPRGREATISWRKPDLKIRNNTEYGILVWNEYTPTSITVSFYSTKHLEVEALPLRRSSDRKCRIDITPRQITFPDGTQTEDSVFALYRPGEGLDCNGNSTTPEEDPPAPAAPIAPTPAPEPEPEPTPTPEPPGPGEEEVLP